METPLTEKSFPIEHASQFCPNHRYQEVKSYADVTEPNDLP